jgi:hypothetical protein
MAVIQGQKIWSWSASHQPIRGQIMKTLRRVQLFASAKRAHKTKDWFERAKLVIAEARDRAVETAQQRAMPAMKRPPTVVHRRRVAQLRYG